MSLRTKPDAPASIASAASLVEVERREDEHLGCLLPEAGEDSAHCLDPVDPRHPYVHEDDVGPGALDEGDGLVAVTGLADDLEVVLTRDDHGDPGAEERLVVDERDPDAHAPRAPSRLVDGSGDGSIGGWAGSPASTTQR